MRGNNFTRVTTPLGGIADLVAACKSENERLKLDCIAKARYLAEKLKLLGLDRTDDPYDQRNTHKFVDDMTKHASGRTGRMVM